MAKKKVISSEKKNGTRWLFVGLGFGLVVSVGMLTAFGVLLWRVLSRIPDDNSNSETSEEDFSEQIQSVNVQKASSCDSLVASMQEAEYKADNYRITDTMEETAPSEGPGMGDEGPSQDLDYSEINVQVEDIDEADVIKTDGGFVYYVKDGSVEVARIYPADQMKRVSKITSDFADYTQIYLYKNKLVALGNYSSEVYAEEDTQSSEEIGVIPDWYYGSILEVWDTSIKAKPSLIKGWMFDSSLSSSRLTEGELYMVMQKTSYYAEGGEFLPQVKAYGTEDEDSSLCDCTEVWIPDSAWSSNFVEVVGLDLDKLNLGLSSEVSFGLGDTVYMSPDHIFVAGEYYEYQDAGDSWWEFWDNWTTPVEPVEKTFISKFDYGGGSADYLGSGELRGALLNQFSMDEYEGYLRVAVTKGRWSSNSSNAVYVLDSDLEIAGRVTGLAKGEGIYSARFVGNRGYIVTFEQMDPLFVIDLSDPTDPEVLGELHIPGYSDYLHPWGENLLIGFGMETNTRYGWVETDGVKIAVFDISDPTDPVELSRLEIGASGSSSEILYNHKALLSNQKDGWFALPIYEYAKSGGVIEYGPGETPAWQEDEFQGLYVFDVDSEGDLSLRGKITHHNLKDFDSDSEAYETFWDREISRGIYVESVLYAISDEKISAHNLANLNKIKQVLWSVSIED